MTEAKREAMVAQLKAHHPLLPESELNQYRDLLDLIPDEIHTQITITPRQEGATT